MTLDVAAVPFLDGVRELASDGVVPGGTSRNWGWIEPRVDPGGHDELTCLLLADAQTSGGLVFGLDPDRVDRVLDELSATGHTAAAIGVTADGDGSITLR